MSSFKCCVCLEDLELNRMPPSSLGCGCAVEICVPCFLRDFDERKRPYLVNEHGVSRWDDPLELEQFLRSQFEETQDYDQTNFEEKWDAYIIDFFYVGKPCAVCNTTVLWKLTEVPAVNPNTGRMTLYAPTKRVQQTFPRS